MEHWEPPVDSASRYWEEIGRPGCRLDVRGFAAGMIAEIGLIFIVAAPTVLELSSDFVPQSFAALPLPSPRKGPTCFWAITPKSASETHKIDDVLHAP